MHTQTYRTRKGGDVFFHQERLRASEALPGIRRSAIWMDRVMMTFFQFEPESVVPEHAHENEQITLVTAGEMEFTLDGETRRLYTGDGVCVPAGVPHSARILDQATSAIDAWAPPREEYRC